MRYLFNAGSTPKIDLSSGRPYSINLMPVSSEKIAKIMEELQRLVNETAQALNKD